MSGEAEERAERNVLVRRLQEIEGLLYPEEEAARPGADEMKGLYERQNLTLAEYSDRIPRVRLSVCPYCSAPLKRAFDPWGLDGPWWHSSVKVKYEEPAVCEHFRVILGALNLGGRTPTEAVSQVLPGPDVPFVVPKLLELPGMVAVIGSLRLATKDQAYPIAYFSDKPTRLNQLHQPWCREAFWYKDDAGRPLWYVANDEFDFELAKFVESGAVKWVHLEEEDNRVYAAADEACPFLDLPGDRERQQLVVGERDLIGLPSGEPVNPFEE
jgi:hypothetical protein